MYLAASAKLASEKPALAEIFAVVDAALANGGRDARLDPSVVAGLARESQARATSALELYVGENVLAPGHVIRCRKDECQQLNEFDDAPPSYCSACGGNKFERKSLTIYRLTETGWNLVLDANAGLETASWPSELASYRGKIHAAIITIKPEEQDAVLTHFPTQHTISGQHEYSLCRIDSEATGGRLLVATVRQMRQGTNAGNTLASHIIEDLDPELLLVVGIAGASPFGDAVLGDVVFGTHVHDLTVRTVTADGGEHFSAAGGPATLAIESAIGALGPRLRSARLQVPGRPKAPDPPKFTTTDEGVNTTIGKQIRDRLASGSGAKVLDGPVISTDANVKDVELVAQWRELMKNALAIEMESAGVYSASRRREKTYPVLPVRSISDIVGLSKEESWVEYACNMAAAYALLFLKLWTPRKR